MPPSHTRRKPPQKKSPVKMPVRMPSATQVSTAVQTMAAPSGTDRFSAGKALAITAEKDPARVYPHFDAIAALIASDSKIVRWNAMQILAPLAAVDPAHKLDAVLDAYLAFSRGSNLISAANAIQGAGKIALARPDLLDRILPAILAVAHATYETPECRNVAIGHTLDVLDKLWPTVRERPEVAAFVRMQRTNTRAAVARRAERLASDLA
jgi:hypothetical protein